jgi:hypothetical protein
MHAESKHAENAVPPINTHTTDKIGYNCPSRSKKPMLPFARTLCVVLALPSVAPQDVLRSSILQVGNGTMDSISASNEVLQPFFIRDGQFYKLTCEAASPGATLAHAARDPPSGISRRLLPFIARWMMCALPLGT